MLERFPDSLPRTKSLGRKGKQALPFAACNAREVWDREASLAKVNDFKKGIGAQIKTQQRQRRQLAQLKQQETEQVRAASEMLLRTQQNESKLHKQQAQQYRRALDVQSGVTAQQTFQTNLNRFYGYDSSTQDYTEAAGRFFGNGEASGSPSRFLKTLPRTTLIDPITGLVRIYPIHRERIQSLGRAKPVQVTAKISDSPPPRSVYHDHPRFEKNIPRRMLFNPLTGERKLLEDKSMPVFSHSFDYRRPPYSLLHRSPYVPKQAL